MTIAIAIAIAILAACAVALFAWAVRSFFRARPGLTPHERAWAKVLGVPNAKTRAELVQVVCPKLHVGRDLSTEGDHSVRALARISPESAREHVHIFEDADWSEGANPVAPLVHGLPVRILPPSPEPWPRIESRELRLRVVPPTDPYPHDEVTEVVHIASPVKR